MRLGSSIKLVGRLIHQVRPFSTPSTSAASQTTHFGFQTLPEEDKTKKVQEVFHNVADQYDLMNDAMSLGIHRFWKDYFMFKLAPSSATTLLDVAGGTGDIAKRFLKHASYGAPDSTATVTVCDISKAMLDYGKQKSEREGWSEGVSWVEGDAEALPFESDTFDAYTIGFGIRNCTHIQKVLDEANRVLKPGGRFMCLEFSQVSLPPLRQAYDWYSFQMIPVMGHVIAGDWESYQYLVESIRQFPTKDDFANMITDAGFRFVKYEDLSCGIVSIHSGFKL